MEIGPVSRALWRNKSSAALVIMQIALTLAVVVNAAFIIDERLEKMARHTGIDHDNMFSLNTRMLSDGDADAFIRGDMEVIRNIPGVVGATPVLSYLQSGSARVDGYRNTRDSDAIDNTLTNVNFIDEQGLDALGIELLAGRWFREDEIKTIDADYNGTPSVVILTETLAKTHFPDGDALGKLLYTGDQQVVEMEIVGIISDVATAWIAMDGDNVFGTHYNFMLQPYRLYTNSVDYIVRTEPGQLQALIPEVEEALMARDRDRLVEDVRTQNEILNNSFRDDRATTIVLVIVIVLMVLITGLGIVGLVSYQVSHRTRQIGVRRALGATRSAVVHYFLTENVLLTTVGVALGIGLSYALNYYVTTELGGNTLNPLFVPVGVAGVYVLGIAASIVPALRASRILPAIATRAV